MPVDRHPHRAILGAVAAVAFYFGRQTHYEDYEEYDGYEEEYEKERQSRLKEMELEGINSRRQGGIKITTLKDTKGGCPTNALVA